MWEGYWQYPQSLHAFVYVVNNPTNHVDPWGLAPLSVGNCSEARKHGYFRVNAATALGMYYNTEEDFLAGIVDRQIKVRVGQNTPGGQMYIDDWTDSDTVGWNMGVNIGKLKWVDTEEWVGAGGLSEITVHGIGRKGDITDPAEPWPNCPYGSEWRCKYDGQGCIGMSNVNEWYIHEKWFDWVLNDNPGEPDKYTIIVEVIGQRPPPPTLPPSPTPPPLPPPEQDCYGSLLLPYLLGLTALLLLTLRLVSKQEERVK